MPYQIKPGPAVESLHLTTMQVMFDSHKMLWDFGYRGSFSTSVTIYQEGDNAEWGRFDMVIDGGVPVSAALGDVILYQPNPPMVVACMSHDQFLADYETV